MPARHVLHRVAGEPPRMRMEAHMAGSAVTPVVILLTLALAGCTVPTDAGNGGSTPPGREDEEFPSLYAGYDAATAPHWSHLRMQMTDYRIQYLSDASARSAEYAWTARHFDRLILDWGDTRSVLEYRRVMPRAELYRYVLTWTVLQPSGFSPDPAVTYYPHMQQWYARHPEYQLENAFLHDATRCSVATKSAACRLSVHIWSSDRWIMNPGDPGLRAYNRERLSAVASDVDGLFIDEHSSGDMADRLKPQSILEYPTWSTYERDVLQLLRDIRAAVGGEKRLLLNTYNYVTSWDVQMTVAAGGAHAEAFNNPVYPQMETRWTHVETLLAAGASMNMLPEGAGMPAGYTAGNSDTPIARRRIWELASYYLVAPMKPGLLFFNSIGDKYDQPFADRWLGAVEANIGAPVGARQIAAEGVDGTGWRYRVWARDYERALVLVRPVIEWGSNSYGDESAVAVPLPSTERFRPLDADGRVKDAVEGIGLRPGEAAILVKEGKVAGK
jgi:hypothetical protein